MIDGKSIEKKMFLDNSEKMVEVQNLLCYCLNIGNNCEGLTPLIQHDSSQFTHCLSLNNLKLTCFLWKFKVNLCIGKAQILKQGQET